MTFKGHLSYQKHLQGQHHDKYVITYELHYNKKVIYITATFVFERNNCSKSQAVMYAKIVVISGKWCNIETSWPCDTNSKYIEWRCYQSPRVTFISASFSNPNVSEIIAYISCNALTMNKNHMWAIIFNRPLRPLIRNLHALLIGVIVHGLSDF